MQMNGSPSWIRTTVAAFKGPSPTVRRTRIALVAIVALSGCATTVTGPRASCANLIPKAWALGVPPAPLPAFDNVGEVATAFIDQSARLESANGRTSDTIEIFSGCEKLVNDSRPRRKVLGVF